MPKMRVRKVKKLSEEEILELKIGRKSGSNIRFIIRCQMMLELHINKKNIQQVSEMFSVGRTAVSCWLNRYESSGIDGLYDRSKSGRPVKNKEKLLKKI